MHTRDEVKTAIFLLSNIVLGFQLSLVAVSNFVEHRLRLVPLVESIRDRLFKL